MSDDVLSMEDLLDVVISEGASDLHITVGAPPMLRVHGSLHGLETDILTPEETSRLMLSVTPEGKVEEMHQCGGADYAIGHHTGSRFRVSIFKQKNAIAGVFRLIPSEFLSLDQIGLPDQIGEQLYKPRGLVLVTGPTGSGKTTTLASMLDVINERRSCHILTIEDPVEYYHNHKSGLVNQREVGEDVSGFSEALRRGLRQDPDVILVGEMRDVETMRAALMAAETGHLVFGTLHTTGAARTVDRIVNAFPSEEQELARTQLSYAANCVISQLLIPRIDKPGRVAAFEIMVATSSVQALIRENKTFRITSDIQTGARYGMVTMDASLLKHYEAGKISYEEMITKAQDPQELLTKLEGRK